jgi:hypothetical protein
VLFRSTDQVWPFRAVVDRASVDLGVRWDTCRMTEPGPACFWYDVAVGPRAWIFAPTDWAGGVHGGVGLRTGLGLTFLTGPVRPTLGAEVGSDLAWGSRWGSLQLPDYSGYWSFEPGGVRADVRIGIEL